MLPLTSLTFFWYPWWYIFCLRKFSLRVIGNQDMHLVTGLLTHSDTCNIVWNFINACFEEEIVGRPIELQFVSRFNKKCWFRLNFLSLTVKNWRIIVIWNNRKKILIIALWLWWDLILSATIQQRISTTNWFLKYQSTLCLNYDWILIFRQAIYCQGNS